MPFDPIARIKDGVRIAVASGLSALSRTQNALEASGERALYRAGLPTKTDIDRLERAVADLDRATASLRSRS